MTTVTQDDTARRNTASREPVMTGRGLVKRYGHVTAINGADFDLYPGEVLAIVGDNGAGKSSLIKALTGAVTPDEGTITLDGREVKFHSPLEARREGIETVYQTLAVAPALDIASNLFLGRERRREGFLGMLRLLDKKGMRAAARDELNSLGIATIQDISQPVETLSGGQRQAVAVARAAMFGSRVVIMDEPTAALGVRETAQVLELIRRISGRGLPVVLISHDMPAVFEVSDRIHVHRLGRRAGVVAPSSVSMSDVVSFITGAVEIPADVDITHAAPPATGPAGVS
jgi:fructose transport system ATP-binding protein